MSPVVLAVRVLGRLAWRARWCLALLMLPACGELDYLVGTTMETNATEGDKTETGESEECATECGSLELCVGGECVCRNGLTRCGTACVDMSNDSAHCGGCDMGCGTGVCEDARCVEGCGDTPCAGTCTSLEEDPQNCGRCGAACASNEVCLEFRCVPYLLPNCVGCPCPECGDDPCCPSTVVGHPVMCVAAEECA